MILEAYLYSQQKLKLVFVSNNGREPWSVTRCATSIVDLQT